ncbi:unnamed protein product [Alternaria burnsii]|nr:unnamed protein product [Alternaria burnsii]
MSDTRAESLTIKLRKEFGNVPSWKVSSTQERLDAQYSHWLIRLMYCERANDYNRYGPIARTEYKMCKKDIGELSEVSEDTIKRWIGVDHLNGFEIKARYQQLFDDKHPNVRKAKKLLAELRRDEGDCRMVGEMRVQGWIENGFDMEVIKQRYRRQIVEAKLFCRAEALRYRLQDELHHEDVASVPDIRDRCRDLDDEQVFAYYRDK